MGYFFQFRNLLLIKKEFEIKSLHKSGYDYIQISYLTQYSKHQSRNLWRVQSLTWRSDVQNWNGSIGVFLKSGRRSGVEDWSPTCLFMVIWCGWNIILVQGNLLRALDNKTVVCLCPFSVTHRLLNKIDENCRFFL